MMHYRQDHNNQPFRQKGLSLRTVADENSKYDITFYMFPFFCGFKEAKKGENVKRSLDRRETGWYNYCGILSLRQSTNKVFSLPVRFMQGSVR